MLFIDLVIVLGAACAGSWAWYQETSKLYQRGDEEYPPGMDHRQRERWVLQKRRRWRLIKTALYAIGGAVATFCILMALALRR